MNSASPATKVCLWLAAHLDEELDARFISAKFGIPSKEVSHRMHQAVKLGFLALGEPCRTPSGRLALVYLPGPKLMEAVNA
jgi:hypothetical protein